MVEKVTIAGLQEQLAAATKDRDAHLAWADKAEGDLATATGQRDAHAEAPRTLKAQNKAQAEEVTTLTHSLRAYKSSATRARNEKTVLQREKSPQARPFGAPSAGDLTQEQRDRARSAFTEAMASGPLELVFSDGKREIRELAPLTVTGDAWRSDARGFTLDHQPVFAPGEMGKPEVSIAGVAAVNEAGEQVGWHGWPEPVRVGRGQQVQLPAGHIRFSF